MRKFVLHTSLMLSLASAALLAHAQNTDLATRRSALQELLRQEWQDHLRDHPETATILGDKRYNDQLRDVSIGAHLREMTKAREYLQKFKALDVSGMSVQEQLNRDLMVQRLSREIDADQFKAWEMPVLQNSGPHLDLPQFVNRLSFDSVKDYDDYIARLKQVPRVFDDSIAVMQKGIADGMLPPRFLLEKVVPQCENLAALPLDESPFAIPLKKMPPGINAADQARIEREVKQAIATHVQPAYKKMAAFVKQDYAPKGRTEVGMWALPNGAAAYAFRVKHSTTTDLSPQQIHEIGLQEVARIEQEMQALASRLGFADVKALNQAIRANPALKPTSRQHIIDLYDQYTAQMYPKLDKLFGHLPKGKMQVRSIEAFREKGAPGAQYQHGTPDGKRPGTVVVNTSEFEKRSLIQIESTALHEGVPGHHLQIALAQELPELPEFRKHTHYNAYVEGWALYAESLGREVGAYQNPYSYYGHLQAEMMRAIRLVVDTGLHYKKWPRQQVVDFFQAHSAIGDVEVQSETDRYIAWPAQALSYKVGQIKITQLRRYAEQELGPQFDIRAFHDVLLGSGSLPLDTLERQVKAWVGQQKALALR